MLSAAGRGSVVFCQRWRAPTSTLPPLPTGMARRRAWSIKSLSVGLRAGAAVPWYSSPMPNIKPKTQAQLVPAQSTGGTLFPFKIPGFGSAPSNNLDASQRTLVDRVNIYLMSGDEEETVAVYGRDIVPQLSR